MKRVSWKHGLRREFIKSDTPRRYDWILFQLREQKMNLRELVKKWFVKWQEGDFHALPISDNFKHTSPFGTIDGKKAYISLVEANKDKFLGYHFEIHDEIYEKHKACVRYTATQGDFTLDVSEWYYTENDAIAEIVAYYHIGEIRDERKLSNQEAH